MKKLLLVSALGLVVSAQAFAAGTEIDNSTLDNKAYIEDSNNESAPNSQANMGSIKLQGGDLLVKDSQILNDVEIRNSDNFSNPNSEANMGSVVVDEFVPTP